MLIEGTDGPDNLNGTASDDVIVGKKGDDSMFGFGGADLFTYNAGHDVASSDGSDTIDGGTGDDTFQANAGYLQYVHFPNSDVRPAEYDLSAGSGGAAVFTLSQDWSTYNANPPITGAYLSTITLKAVENFSFISTHDPAPMLSYPVFYTTDDRLTVGDLSSTGLTGQISFDGGSGNDRLDAHAATNAILAYGGTGDDTLIGGLGNNTLYGQDGNDALRAGGGPNTLIGGTGNDTYYVNAPADTIVEASGEGVDAVVSGASYVTLGPNLENLFHSGVSDFTGIGNAGDNWIQGGPGSDYLIGLDGNDYLYGGAGAANALQGGTGNDTYIIENPGDSPIEFANEGHDTVLTTLTNYTLRTNFEDLRFSGSSGVTGTGNDADNSIQGSSGNDHLLGLGGNDTLDGGSGANILEGGTGDDLYIVRNAGDTVIEWGGEGHDTVQTTLSSYALAMNVEDLNIQNGGGYFSGNAYDNVIHVLGAASYVDGGAGNDTIVGGAGNDVLSGSSGNDILTGGAGGDELTGGSGADHFVFTTANDGPDLIHDFSHIEGDKIDVSQLLAALGPVGADPFADGVLTFEPIAAIGSTSVPATRVLLDVDGSAGAAAPTTLFIALGSTSAVDHNDFILV